MSGMYCGGHGLPLPCKTCADNLARSRSTSTPAEIRAWCALCGVSRADSAVLLRMLFPSMSIAEALGEGAAS